MAFEAGEGGVPALVWVEGANRHGQKRPSSSEATPAGVIHHPKRTPWVVVSEKRAAKRQDQQRAVDVLVTVIQREVKALARTIDKYEKDKPPIETTYDDHVAFESRFVLEHCPVLVGLLFGIMGLPLEEINQAGTAFSTEDRHKKDKVSSLVLQLVSATSKRNPNCLAKLLSREIRKSGGRSAPPMLSALGLLRS